MMERIIEKEKFIQIVKTLKDTTQLQNNMYDLFYAFEQEHDGLDFNVANLAISHEGIVIELLECMFNDVCNTISWWIYETNYGEERTQIYDSDTKKVIEDIDTAEKLYDYLIKCMNENKHSTSCNK